ncbi:hypothetical protein LAC81_35695 (plasmid) [Ensifer adhaerens]|uniref:hypothetical protein n=1 Tax=Ensifer adhaerens TaxID=106592 RepID=UPI001CC15BB7|nr:hypothetical protein [Ensifer adhaerens]MBZ7927286.1 hypothetical protein [Ensifer adhaerens]UAX98301.1 hypothetical protein LAC78_36995 [Ensifer adhaerens]UAY05684.1 hypothetical protein LAC80_35700 [Ensifer adhaerens]UAY13062.1 hypothetical protein LAC81_35695 [Ensifer adhaerens]
MSDPKDKKGSGEPMPKPISKPRPPEMDLEPIPLPDLSGASQDTDEPSSQRRVQPVPSRDEANIEPDEALPDDTEEEILEDDPERENSRFDEEVPRSSR